MEQQPITPQTTRVIITKPKSVGVALLLTFFFGPLGLLYASVVGGIVMIILSAIIGIFTLGIGLIFTWIACIVWAVISVNNSNKQLESQASALR